MRKLKNMLGIAVRLIKIDRSKSKGATQNRHQIVISKKDSGIAFLFYIAMHDPTIYPI